MPRDRHIRYWVMAALCIITALNYIQRNCLGPIETTIREDFRLPPDTTLTGLAMGIFFFSYALAQIPSGWLAQKWGPRKALTLLAASWSLTTIIIAASPGIYSMIGLRLVLGALQAGIFPCATLIMASWLPPTRRALGSGLLTASMYAGMAFVANLTGFLLEPLGWRNLLVLYGAPGIIWAVLFYLWFRDQPQDHRSVSAQELAAITAGRAASDEPSARSAKIPWLLLLASASMWLICIQQFFRAGGARFSDMWLSTYLQEASLSDIADTAIRKATANHLASFAGYAGMAGGLIGGWFSDWVLQRSGSRWMGRNGVAVASLFLMIVCFVPLFIVRDAYVQIVFFCLGAFLGSGVNSVGYAISMDVGGKHLFVVFSTMNMVGNLGSMTLTYSFPLFKKLPGGWTCSLALLVAVHAIALVCWLFLNPNRSIGEELRPAKT